MKRMRIKLVGVVILLGALALFAGAVLAATSFEGVWKSIDPFDGSRQTLVIKPWDGKYIFQYVDKGASICGLDADGQPLYAAVGNGYGTAHENVFDGRMKLFCLGPEPWYVGAYDLYLTYLPESDSLTDPAGTNWIRTR